MTGEDYRKWADGYYHEAEVLHRKITEKRRKQFFKTAEEREKNDRAVERLYAMRVDCLKTHDILMKKAIQIEEMEKSEKHRIHR